MERKVCAADGGGRGRGERAARERAKAAGERTAVEAGAGERGRQRGRRIGDRHEWRADGTGGATG